jgi:uncharacterized protein (TIGR02117 family)
MRRWAIRLGWSVLAILVLVLAATLVTMRPGDARLYPVPVGEPRTDVFVVSHGYHAGIALPRARVADVSGARGYKALSAVASRFGPYEWLEIGWGDEGFYTSVPTMGSLTVLMAARALLRPGNPSVLHVVGLLDHPRMEFPDSEIVPVALSEAGFVLLLKRLEASYAPGPQELGHGLYGPSLFYRAVGTFHLFRVCNHWLADLLDAAGVPTAPVPATLPGGLMLDLRWRSGVRPLPLAATP